MSGTNTNSGFVTGSSSSTDQLIIPLPTTSSWTSLSGDVWIGTDSISGSGATEVSTYFGQILILF